MLSSAPGVPVAQACSIIGAVCQQLVTGTADGEQRPGASKIVGIPGRQSEGDRPAAIVARRVDFSRTSAARGANGVMISPHLRPLPSSRP